MVVVGVVVSWIGRGSYFGLERRIRWVGIGGIVGLGKSRLI